MPKPSSLISERVKHKNQELGYQMIVRMRTTHYLLPFLFYARKNGMHIPLLAVYVSDKLAERIIY